MSLLRANQATRLKAKIEAAMNGTCAIYGQTFTPDGHGGQTVATDATARSTVACTLIPLSAYEKEQAGAKPEEALFAAILPGGTDVRVTDLLLIDAVWYEVTGVTSGSTALTARATCTRKP